jgi:hypothetical protein
LGERVHRDLLNLWFFVRIIVGKDVIVREVWIVIEGEIWGIAFWEVRITLTIVIVYGGNGPEIF